MDVPTNRLDEVDDNNGGPGRFLREARKTAGIDQAEIARRLNLEIRAVDALERDDYSELPPLTFVRGYVRAYAKIVELPEDEILARFAHDTTTVSTLDSGTARSQASMGDAPVRWVTYLVGIGLVVLVVAWWQGRVPDLAAPFETSDSVESAASTDAEPDVAVGGSMQEPVRTQVYAPPAPNAPEESSAAEPVPSGGLTSEEMEAMQPDAASQPAGQSGADDTSVADSVPSETQAAIETQSVGEQTSVVNDPGASTSQVVASDESRADETTAEEATGEEVAAGNPASGESAAASGEGSPSADSTETSTQAASAPGTVRIGDVGRDRLTLRFDGDCWTSVVDGADRRLIYRLVKGGSVIEVTGDAPFRVTLGNSDAVAVALNGEDFDHAPFARANIARFTVGTAR